ncbi:hypothetical protein TNCV_756111 [Trichonephila clavipes]|nr:hypothetical protein TNCV_756111 [Trichonephila clavipes]
MHALDDWDKKESLFGPIINGRILNSGLSSSYPRTGGNSQIGETFLFSTADPAKSMDYSSKDNPRILPANFGGHEKKKIAVNRKSCAEMHVNNIPRDYQCPITTSLTSRERITLGCGNRQFENKKRELLGSYRQVGVTQSSSFLFNSSRLRIPP